MKGSFKIILLFVFLSAAVVGLLAFSGVIPLGGGGNQGAKGGTLSLWGTAPASAVSPLLEQFNRANKVFLVRYEEKSSQTLSVEFLEALLSGTGPDMILATEDIIFRHRKQLFSLPYQGLPLSAFRESFISAGEVFALSGGILALPVAVDPLVMYYNRSMLDSAGISRPLAFWDESPGMVSLLTKKDSSGRILKSAVALGQYANVENAKAILSALFIQSGNQIVREDTEGLLSSSLGSIGTSGADLASALRFYADFSDPLKNLYSWNRSIDSARSAFARGDLAFYFGFGSELDGILKRNPNQSLGIAPLPGVRGKEERATFARVWGLAVPALSRNLDSAFETAGLLTRGEFAFGFASALGAAPARRGAAPPPENPYLGAVYSSALYARSWPDPASEATGDIFRGMVERVLSSAMTAPQAISDAHSKLGFLLLKSR